MNVRAIFGIEYEGDILKKKTVKELNKYNYLVGFVNEVCDIISDPEEYLDSNEKDSSVLSIGYDSEPIIKTIDGDDSVDALKENLEEIIRILKSSVKKDYAEEWEKLRR